MVSCSLVEILKMRRALAAGGFRLAFPLLSVPLRLAFDWNLCLQMALSFRTVRVQYAINTSRDCFSSQQQPNRQIRNLNGFSFKRLDWLDWLDST